MIVEDSLVYSLGLEHLPIYRELNQDGRLLYELVRSLVGKKGEKLIRSAMEVDPGLEHLPVIESAEIYWRKQGFGTDWSNNSVFDKSIAYVGGLIQSEKYPKNLFLIFSVGVDLIDNRWYSLPKNPNGFEDIKLIERYKPLR